MKSINDLDWGDGKFNIHKVEFGGVIKIVVQWANGYEVIVVGSRTVKLRDKYKELDRAKQAGLNVAKRLVKKQHTFLEGFK
jgi:hypothetical protein